MLRSIFHSEWKKMFSYNWCIVGMISAVLLPSLALLFSANTTITGGLKLQSADIITLCLRYLYLGQVGIVIAMAGFFGQEYTCSMLRTTLLANSSRMKVLLIKKMAIIFSAIIAGILSSILCLLAITIKSQNELTFTLISSFTKAISCPVISWVLLGEISANLSIITKSLTIPIALLFPLILGLSQMLLAVTTFVKYLPDLAGMNLFLMPEQSLFLPANIGIAVQMIWAVLLGCIANYLFYKRDIR